ncbi:MAG TPA: T9SS type A sorting domain-containing protein [Parasegetibacter sp.]
MQIYLNLRITQINRIIMFHFLFFCARVVQAQQVYLWSGLSTDWTQPSAWIPERITPSVTDELLFNTNAIISHLPAFQKLSKLELMNAITVEINSPEEHIIEIGSIDNPGSSFFVGADAVLKITGEGSTTIKIPTGCRASCNGKIEYSEGAHRLMADDAGAIVFNSGSTFLAGPQFSGSPFGTETLNSVVFKEDASFISQAGSNPFGAGAPNSVVVFESGSNYVHRRSTSPQLSGRIYPNFIVDAQFSYNLPLGSDWTIKNKLIIKNGSGFTLRPSAGTGNLIIEGGIICEDGSTMNVGIISWSGMIKFHGDTQTLAGYPGQSSVYIERMEVNLNGLRLNMPVSVGLMLSLKKGIIYTDPVNILTFEAAGYTISGPSQFTHLPYSNFGNEQSYIDGPVKKLGLVNGEVFVFPTGNQGIFRPLILKNVTGDFQVVYRRNDPHNLNPQHVLPLHHFSQLEYWEITGSENATAQVELSFADPNSGGVTNLDDLRVCQLLEQGWEANAIDGYLGTAGSNGSITTSSLQNFGYFALGSVSALNSLPVNNIKASLSNWNGKIAIDFQTVKGSTAAYYIIQQSTDGRKFVDIDLIKAGGPEDPADYRRIFPPPDEPISYFRVKMTGIDQKEIFSNVLTYKAPKPALKVYPNPAVEKISVFFPFPSSKSILEIVNSNGKVLYQNRSNGSHTTIPVGFLKPGVYFIKFYNSEDVFIHPFIKQF